MTAPLEDDYIKDVCFDKLSKKVTDENYLHVCTLSQLQIKSSFGSLILSKLDTVNPEYFVHTKFSYAGYLRPLVRLKYSYSH